MGWGCTYYRTQLPEIPVQSVLTLEVHDYAQIWIGNKFIGKIDRVKNEKSITLPPVKKGEQLTILVEAIGAHQLRPCYQGLQGTHGHPHHHGYTPFTSRRC